MKLKDQNRKEFNDNKYQYAKGGNISKKMMKLRNHIIEKKVSFKDYIDYRYNAFPYDDDLSLNKNFVDFILRFDHLQADFKTLLEHLDIEQIRELPVVNKTKKKQSDGYNRHEILPKFLSFFHHNKEIYGEEIKPNYLNLAKFKILLIFRRIIRFYQDKNLSKRKSMQDYGY